MYKMIIADDEPLIRTGLKNLIEWEVYGIEIVAEADDGTNAYLAIKKWEPDIALIDITMPNMTGLELIELCSHLEHCPKFIILSGYNNFEYVRTAMKYGAVNYLLKPVDQEELTNTIISTLKLLEDVSMRKLQFQESFTVLRNDILLRVLTNRIDNRELREKCHFLNLSFHCSNMRIAILKPQFSDEQRSIEWTHSPVTLCEELCKNICTVYAMIDTSDNIVLIFKDLNNTVTPETYQGLLKKCAEHLEKQTNCPFTMILSDPTVGVSELSRLYTECLNKLEYQEITLNLFSSNVLETLEDSTPLTFDYARFSESLEKQDDSALQELLHTYFSKFLYYDIEKNLEIIKYQLIEFIICTMQELKSTSLSDTDILTYKKQAFRIVNTTYSLQRTEAKLLDFFRNLMNQLNQNTNPAYSPLIQNSLNYTKNHYHNNNLALKTLANKFGVNAAYLGRQFSLETNEYFSDYLNRIRIAQAIHLLKTTDWKISAIATSVGFSNISYFFTIFKKITGGRPGDYRK